MTPGTEMLLIRHAPVAEPGRLAGRTDLAARIEPEAIAALAALLAAPRRIVTSPAARCVETARALFPGRAATTDPRLWEQDFGRYDGAPLESLPDIGALSAAALAAHRWEGGESFEDMAARVASALSGLPDGGPVAIVAHAGTVRAALAWAMGATAPALAFQVAPLSLTRLTRHPAGIAVGCVNRTAT